MPRCDPHVLSPVAHSSRVHTFCMCMDLWAHPVHAIPAMMHLRVWRTPACRAPRQYLQNRAATMQGARRHVGERHAPVPVPEQAAWTRRRTSRASRMWWSTSRSWAAGGGRACWARARAAMPTRTSTTPCSTCTRRSPTAPAGTRRPCCRRCRLVVGACACRGAVRAAGRRTAGRRVSCRRWRLGAGDAGGTMVFTAVCCTSGM